jgi:hypothetical protein
LPEPRGKRRVSRSSKGSDRKWRWIWSHCYSMGESGPSRDCELVITTERGVACCEEVNEGVP